MINVGVVGGTGYTGVELLRLLVRHPEVRLTQVTSRGEAGKPVAELFPNLLGHTELCFSEPDIDSLAESDLVFFATPTGIAMQMAPQLLARGVRVIDLAADYRLKDVEQWRHWYGKEHSSPELLAEAVYGLPEFNRELITNAQLVACPGCYPTAVQLGFAPLLKQGLVALDSLIADAKSGVSGAGRQAKVGTLLAETSESLSAYAVAGHRHLPEILQGLRQVSASAPELTFVPHLTPMIRGIQATLYARLTPQALNLSLEQLHGHFAEHYAAEPFVSLLPLGQYPATRNVRSSNQCQIAIERPQNGPIVVVLSVIDNLVKGAAGQAVQNMNLMFGLNETLGLEVVAVLP